MPAPARSRRRCAAAIRPRLRLRVPELVEAVREVNAGGGVRRIEFAERVPTERHFEAFVSPVAVGGPACGAHRAARPDLDPPRRGDARRLSSPTPAMSCARRSPRSPDSSRRCRVRRATIPRRATASSASCASRPGAWRRLIDDLLSLSRIELRAHMRPDTPVDLVPIVRQVVDGLQTLAQDRGVTIEVASAAEPLTVLGDRDELLRLFENLIENGLKYGASGKRVDIALASLRCRGRQTGSQRRGARLRAGDRGRASASADRTVLPGRCRREPGAGRHRIGTCAGQAHPQPPSRPARHRVPARARARHSQCGCQSTSAWTKISNSSFISIVCAVIQLSSISHRRIARGT